MLIPHQPLRSVVGWGSSMGPIEVSVRRADAVASGTHAQKAQTHRWPITYRSVEVLVQIIDALVIIGASIGAGFVYSLIFRDATGDIFRFAATGAVVSALYIPAIKMRDLYDPASFQPRDAHIRVILSCWLGVFLFLTGVVFALKIGKEFSRGATLGFAGAGLVALLAHRAFWVWFLARALAEGNLRGKNVILIADEPLPGAAAIVQDLVRLGFQVQRQFFVNLFGNDATDSRSVIASAVEFARNADVDEVFLSVSLQRWGDLSPDFSELRSLPVPVTLLPDPVGAALLSCPLHKLGSRVAVEFQRAPMTTVERGLKRVLDIIGSSLGLLVLLPLLTITGIAVKLDSAGPVLFRQTRHGFNGKPFRIFKFRTMLVLEDGAVVKQAQRNDNRITRVGKWLRRTSIDELPQLINVLKGDMSLVGPRPHAIAHDDYFSKLIGNYAFRHHVKPGITGWAQVNGYRGETPTVGAMERRVRFDLWYVDNWTIQLDVVILFRTLIEIFRGKNAY